MILCCGEALIDLLPRSLPDGESAFVPKVGGAVANTAIALARLGAPCGLLTGLSQDFFGARLRDALQRSGVDLRYLVPSDQPTPLAFVQLHEGQASYAFFDEQSAVRSLTPAMMPALDETVQAVFVGGISLASDPCASAMEAMMTSAAGSRVTMIDPNIRPAFIRDEAGYRARIDRMIRQANIVKVSLEDLQWLAGIALPEDDAVTYARRWLAQGVDLVLLTFGGEGVVALHGQHATRQAAAVTTVVDTVGAGDTFNAGVLAALMEAGLLTTEALRTLSPARLAPVLAMGVQAAAVTVSRAGANPPWREELNSRMARLQG